MTPEGRATDAPASHLPFRIPDGDLVQSRVVDDAAVALEAALAREHTGYAVLEPQRSLLLDGETTGILTFEAGVPVLAYDAATDTGGTDALAQLAAPGPYHVDLYDLPSAALAVAHETPELTVPPGLPAERLAGDTRLAERTTAAAPPDRRATADHLTDDESGPSAVEAFLADEERIAAIQDQAREEARAKAVEWGYDGALAESNQDE